MAYSDPQSLTIAGGAKSLVRTGMNSTSGQFRTADQKYKFILSHNTSGNGRTQHVVRLELSDIVANPLVPSANQAVSAAATLTINQPINGLAPSVISNLADAIVAWATPANTAKLVGGES